MGLSVGDIVQDKYRIVGLIGEGGMGAVYEGENTLISRRVAIKALHNSAAVNPEIVKRFQREAQAAGRIGNDHILEVLDLGKLPDGDLFMVMEYLDGESFADRIDRMIRMTPQQVYPIARQILEGLTAAHGAGIIHRDLKPENIFILKEKAGQHDYVKIIDFGISKFNVMDGDMQMTATGAVMGTPYYMAPEQAKGGTGADPRCDLYAIGVMLYKSITGDEPFSADTFNELLFKIVLSDLIPAKQLVPELDEAFDSIISKAMAKDPDYRFSSCEDMIGALDAWAQSGVAVTVPPPPPTDDPRMLAGIVPAQAPPGAATPQFDPSQSDSQAAAAAADWRQSDAGVGAAQALGQQTPGSWAEQSVAVVPKKSYAGLLVALAGIAVLVLVVGGVGAYKLVSSGSGGDSEAAAASEGSEEAAEGQETSLTEATSAEQPEVKPPEEKPEPTAEQKADEAAEEKADAGAAKPKKKKPAKKTASRPKPAQPPPPAKKPPPPAPKPAKHPGGLPDFGY